MPNLNSRLIKLEERLKITQVIDPEYAIKSIINFIRLSSYDRQIATENQVSHYEFIRIFNDYISHDIGDAKRQRTELWNGIEADIRNKSGFRPDTRDGEATNIKEF